MSKHQVKSDASFFDSWVKEMIRNQLAEICPLNANVMTLAGPEGKDAKTFASRKKARVTTVEHNRQIFEKQFRDFKYKSQIFPFFGEADEMLEVFGRSAPPFDLIYLDFCGPYSVSKERTIIKAMGKVLNPEGYLAITLLMSREYDIEQTKMASFLEMGGETYRRGKIKAVEAAIDHFSLETNVELRLEQSRKYSNDENEDGTKIKREDKAAAVSMMFLLYKKTRGSR